MYLYIHGGPKNGPFFKVYDSVYDEVGRRSIYQNVELFIRSKTNIRNVAIFTYSWHKFGETILCRKYQLV